MSRARRSSRSKSPRPKPSSRSRADEPLSPKRQRFIGEFLVDLNGTQAAIRAGYSKASAKVTASRLLTDANISAAIAAAQAARAKRLELTADRIARELWELYDADVNELVEFRRTCCRHCYGDGFGYQLTEREMAQREAEWAKRRNPKPTDPPFDPLGGTGYDARKAPNAECPECFGSGVGTVHFKDSRTLSPAARRLYNGVKVGKDGTEMKVLDRMTALIKVGEHLGMFRPQTEPPESDEARAKRIRAELEAMDSSIGDAA